jgi:polyisoprenoid-binding protein YceI
MLKTLLLCSWLLVLQSAFSQASLLLAEPSTSEVKFQIKNFGVNVDGSFKGLSGIIQFNAERPLETSINASVDAGSINTGIGARDNHLRKTEYFDATAYPRISFLSTKITNSTKAGTYFIYGLLTIKKTTKEISFPFTVTPQNSGYLFEGSFQIDRRDYGVGGKSISLNDKVTVSLKVMAK